mmetsp:Transcript_53809/g.161043  ORF Transcript_53809/g.161043 Transcript_53809/m.161043 type:complete len:92 (-) Transcript_53809:129-404(-)
MYAVLSRISLNFLRKLHFCTGVFICAWYAKRHNIFVIILAGWFRHGILVGLFDEEGGGFTLTLSMSCARYSTVSHHRHEKIYERANHGFGL